MLEELSLAVDVELELMVAASSQRPLRLGLAISM